MTGFTMAMIAADRCKRNPEAWWMGFGTGPASNCSYCISGLGYVVGWMKDQSAVAIVKATGYCYGITDKCESYNRLNTWAKIGRLITELDGAKRAEQTLEYGVLIASTAGASWYKLGETVWCVRSMTQCDYHCLFVDWELPTHATAAA